MRRPVSATLLVTNALSGLLVGIGVLATRDAEPVHLPPPVDVMLVDNEIRYRPNPAHPLNNEAGFRGGEIPPKSDGVTRIVFLGDSSTYSSHRDGYVERLGELHGNGCEFINAASSSMDVLDMYVRYERDVLPLDPDIVVVALPSAHFVVRRPSIGVDLLAFGLEHLAALASEQGDALYLIAMPITRDTSVKTWPTLWGHDATAEEAYLARLYAVMRESGIPVLDAASAIGWTDEMFDDQIHLSANGYQWLAEWLDSQMFRAVCSSS